MKSLNKIVNKEKFDENEPLKQRGHQVKKKGGNMAQGQFNCSHTFSWALDVIGINYTTGCSM